MRRARMPTWSWAVLLLLALYAVLLAVSVPEETEDTTGQVSMEASE